MDKRLEAFEDLTSNYPKNYSESYHKVLNEIKALHTIISIFDIKIVGDYLIARRGETCIVYNLKLKQSQEIINLLKEVLL